MFFPFFSVAIKNTSIQEGKTCKVCQHKCRKSLHENFYFCKACGCYSNYLQEDKYDDEFWYHVNYSDNFMKQEYAHWKKISKIILPFISKYSFNLLIDLAGGLGWFSAVLQDYFKRPVINVDLCKSPDNMIRYNRNYSILNKDVFDFLQTIKAPLEKCLIINSHFIEHLEKANLINFIIALKSAFNNSVLIIYSPAADKARKHGENKFLHFNTNLKGEHRIIWNYKTLKYFLSAEIELKIIFSRLIDQDQFFLCHL